MMVTVLDVGDRIIKVTFFRNVSDIFMTFSFKKSDTKFSKMSPTHFVTNIRDQVCTEFLVSMFPSKKWVKYSCGPKNGSSIVVKKLESKFSLE